VIRPVCDRIAANHYQDDKARHAENSRSYRQSFPPKVDQDTTKTTRSSRGEEVTPFDSTLGIRRSDIPS
jgi:hypothetical protein